MPSYGFKKDDPLDTRLKVQFSASHTALIRQAADMVGMTVSAYIRAIVLAHLEETPQEQVPTPSTARQHAAMLELAEEYGKLKLTEFLRNVGYTDVGVNFVEGNPLP